MHGITHIGSSMPPALQTQVGTSSSGAAAGAFQAALAPPSAATPVTQSVAIGKSATLGSQVVSTLLQTQDIDQAKTHGHGGGGHHGGMKITTNLEAEEAGEIEEAQLLKARKALAQKLKVTTASGVVEVDENGVPITEESEDTTKPESASDKRSHA